MAAEKVSCRASSAAALLRKRTQMHTVTNSHHAHLAKYLAV